MSLDAPHVAFVLAAYGVAAAVFAALALGLAMQHRARARDVAELERAGARRRAGADAP